MEQTMLTGADIPTEELAVEDEPSATLAPPDPSGIPTYDNLAQAAQAGLDGPSADQMMKTASSNLGGGVEYKGMEAAQKILLYRADTGEATPVPLLFAAGRQSHDWARYYLSKKFPIGDVNIPQVLWGKSIFLRRPPANPPMAVKGPKDSCLFCAKTNFPSETERRRHMQAKHKNEYAEHRRALDESASEEERGLLRKLLAANTDAIRTLVQPEGREPTTGEKQLAARIAKEVEETDEDAASLIGNWWPRHDALQYYRVGISKIDQLIQAGDIAARKEGNRWSVFVPIKTWTPEKVVKKSKPKEKVPNT